MSKQDRETVEALKHAIELLTAESKKYAVDANIYSQMKQEDYIHGKRAYEKYQKIMRHIKAIENLITVIVSQKRLF